MPDTTPTDPTTPTSPDDRCSCRHRRGTHDADGCQAMVDVASHDPEEDWPPAQARCPCEAFAPWIDVTDHVLAIERMQVVDLQPGDTIIATLAPGSTQELAAAVEYDLMGRYPDNDINVLAPGVSLHVMRPAPAPVVNVHQHIEGDPQRAGDFLRDKGWRLDPGPAGSADEATQHPRDRHRPVGYTTVTAIDAEIPEYLDTIDNPICGARCESPAGVWHCCNLPPSHNDPASPAPALQHHCRCGDSWSAVPGPADPTEATP